MGSSPSWGKPFGTVAQLVERHSDTVAVVGSIPTRPTFFYSGMAQLVARRAHNPKVVSSNLTPASLSR
jgi:hypothetical protein